jgi:predicted transcriptional regulator
MMNDPLSGIMSTELITVSPSDAMTTVLDLFKKKNSPLASRGQWEVGRIDYNC